MSLLHYLDARSPVTFVVTHEEQRVVEEIRTGWAPGATIHTWTVTHGLDERDPNGGDPEAILRKIIEDTGTDVVYVLHDFHAFLKNPLVCRAVRDLATRTRSVTEAPGVKRPGHGLAEGTVHVVITAPSADGLPPELRGDIPIVDLGRPTRQRLQIIAQKARAAGHAGDEPAELATALAGLTVVQARLVLALTIAEHGEVRVPYVLRAKAKVLAADVPGLEIITPDVTLDDVAGLDALVAWIKSTRAVIQDPDAAKGFGLPSPRGVLFVGAPGCLHGDTPIHDPVDGTTCTVRERFEAREPFHVWAMGEVGPVVTAALPPVRYGAQQFIEFTTETGTKIQVTSRHRFWDGTRWIYAAEVYERLRGSEPVLLASSSDSDLQVRVVDGLRWSETTPGSLVDCRPVGHSGGEPLPPGAADDGGASPSRGDVHGRTPARWRPGGRGATTGRSRPCRSVDRPSTRGWRDRQSAQTKAACPGRQRQPAGWRARHARCSTGVGQRWPQASTQTYRAARLPGTARPSTADFVAATHRVDDGTGWRRARPGTSSQVLPTRVRRQRSRVATAQPAQGRDAAVRGAPSRTSRRSSRWSLARSRSSARLPVQDALRATASRQEAVRRGSRRTNRATSTLASSQHITSPVGFVKVVGARLARRAPYYDFHVPLYSNYWACGLWHHNCGKSLTAKALASGFGLGLLRVDLGAMMGSLVGQSESQIRRALQVAEAMAPVVLWIDEIEKAVSAGQIGGGGDSGTSSRVIGTFITWMSEKTAPVFVACTANRPEILPPELLRKGRFDEMFAIDLPDLDGRVAIFTVHLKKRQRDVGAFDLTALAKATDGYSGAEVEAVVLAGLRQCFVEGKRPLTTEDLLAEIRVTVPLSKSMGSEIENMRSWARGRARDASGKSETPTSAASASKLGF